MKSIAAKYRPAVHTRNLVKIGLGTVWMILASQIAVPLPFTQVPLTLGPQAAIFLGMFLGRKLAPLSVISFITMGATGAPLFAGWRPFLGGPTTGYLFGYVFAAWMMGWMMERMPLPNTSKTFGAALFAHIPIYLLGLAWLVPFVGIDNVLMCGLFPFVPGLLAKSLVMSLSAQKLKTVIDLK